MSTPPPPAVPAWTRELALDKTRRSLKRSYLLCRGLVLSPFVQGSAPPPPLSDLRRIVVVRTDRLGDAVLTFPLVQRLKDLAPAAEIVYALRRPWVALFEGQKKVDRVLALSDSSVRQVRDLESQRPDLIIDPCTDPLLKPARLCKKSGARCRVGFAGHGREIYLSSYRETPAGPKHFTEELFALLKWWTNEPTGRIRTPFLEISPSAQRWWNQRTAEYPSLSSGHISIHPGGHYETQRWPAERFLDLAGRIQSELDVPVIWCTPGEDDEFLPKKNPKLITFSHLEVSELAAVLGRSSLFIGNNSGPLHLASALGTPTVSLMGPTVPYRWSPLGDHHRILRLGVACSPCNLGRCSHHTCLRAIRVRDVLEAVAQQLPRERARN